MPTSQAAGRPLACHSCPCPLPTLARLRRVTGLSISEMLERGLMAYQTTALEQVARKPFDIYARLVLGDGGDALWDPMIIVAAAIGGASALMTEDLNPGQIIEGVQIRNPFL